MTAILVTGFGAFQDVVRNPSAELARALADAPPAGVRVVAGELPVEIDALPGSFDALIGALGRPDALLALGVHRGPELRLERRARCRLQSQKTDNVGRLAAGVELEPARDFETRVDVDAAAEVLRAAWSGPVVVSADAGGYVCERTYHYALWTAERLNVPALFLHVPPVEAIDPTELLPPLGRLATELARQAEAQTSR